jgi:hypothetical protein
VHRRDAPRATAPFPQAATPLSLENEAHR